MQRRGLIVYAKEGNAHLSAATAIREAFATRFPDTYITCLDVLDFAPSFYSKCADDGLGYVHSRLPALWGWYYRRYKHSAGKNLTSLVPRLLLRQKFLSFLRRYRPNFLVLVHPVPIHLLDPADTRGAEGMFLSVVVTDYGSHGFWVDDVVDQYLVPSQEHACELRAFGISPSRIRVTGIPIQAKFLSASDRVVIARHIRLRPDLFTLLVVGGQLAFSDLRTILIQVREQHSDAQFIVVSGRDRELERSLRRSPFYDDARTRIYGFADNMHQLMSVSDLILSKPGGLTVSESMAKQLPMLIYRVIPGQEEENADYLVSRGAAIRVNDVRSAIHTIKNLIVNRDKMLAMKEACREIARPSAAADCADSIYEQLSSS